MKKILIINTGGTFNKEHDILSGDRIITENAVPNLLENWLADDYSILNIIKKDSLDFTNKDREILFKTIKKSKYKRIVVIHGTDTIDVSSEYIKKYKINKKIIFTGAMTPYAENNIEATANFASAIGYISAINKNGVYISMNGVINKYNKIIKNRDIGKFIKK